MPLINIEGRHIECRMIPGDAGRQPLEFLHEGLGSAAQWRDFPDNVAKRLGAPTLVYSRLGYGQSDRLLAKNTPQYMHNEALEVLPRLLDALGIERPLLVGHSDGASIALIHAAASGRAVRGLVLLAPHVFVEPVCLTSIAQVRESYFTTDLKERLAKHHAHVDDTFFGWVDTWLLPEFAAWSIEDLVPRVTQPMLLIQGLDDEYGTLEQPDRIEARARAPVRRLELASCGHSPHRDQEAAVLEAIVEFAGGLAP